MKVIKREGDNAEEPTRVPCDICGKLHNQGLTIHKNNKDFIVQAFVCENHYVDYSQLPWVYDRDVSALKEAVEQFAHFLRGSIPR